MSKYLIPLMSIDRLRIEWEKHNGLVIAFDYDSTVMPFHKNEYKFDYEPVRELLRDLKSLGCTLICFTASRPERYDEIKAELKTIKVPYDYFNQSPPFAHELGIGVMGKVYANVYLDDRAGMYQVFTELTQLVTEKKLEKHMQYFHGMAAQSRK